MLYLTLSFSSKDKTNEDPRSFRTFSAENIQKRVSSLKFFLLKGRRFSVQVTNLYSMMRLSSRIRSSNMPDTKLCLVDLAYLLLEFPVNAQRTISDRFFSIS